MQLKVERDLVLGRVEEVDEPAEDLERELEKVVSRAEGEDGVEGGDAASARGEDEEVAVAVRGQRRGVAARARRCGTRELFLEDAQVRLEPACWIVSYVDHQPPISPLSDARGRSSRPASHRYERGVRRGRASIKG